MVGGTIVDVKHLADKTMLTVEDRSNDSGHGARICVEVEPGHDFKMEDIVWWQGGHVYWTRKGSCYENIFSDVAVPKIGYSYGYTHRSELELASL
jgi:hypothetical protein